MSLEITVKSDLSEWNKLKSRLLNKSDSDSELQIGFFEDDHYGPENNYLPVAAVAAWQDLGAPFEGVKHIPPRPFMRVGLKGLLKEEKYLQKYKTIFTGWLKGNKRIDASYRSIEKDVVPDLKKIIDAWTTPPNAAYTIAQKGRDDPLVDTGKMRDSVKARVSKTIKHQIPLF